MTVAANTAKGGPYLGDGVQYIFDIPFYFLASTDIKVTITDTLGNDTVLNPALYTVTGAGVVSGLRNISMLTPAILNSRVTITRNMDFLQGLDLGSGDDLPSESLERAYDKLTMMGQQLLEEVSRCLKLSPSTASGTLSLPTPQAYYVLGWNALGTGLINIAPDAASALIAQNAAAAAIAAASSINIPAITIANFQSILRVNAAGTGYDIVTFKEQILTTEVYTNLFL